MKLCLGCGKKPAIESTIYGFLPCIECSGADDGAVGSSVEMIPGRIKEERKERYDDTLQPFRKGVLSKEYLSKYGTKYIKVSPDEIKNSRNVWGRDVGKFYKD